MSVCAYCGHEVSETSQFCPSCGIKLHLAPPSTVTAEVQPPEAPKPSPASTNRPTPREIVHGLPENIAGVLAYFVLPAILFLFVQPFNRNRFVRFHSYQCVITVGVLIFVQFALILLARALPLMVLPLFGLLALAEFTLWLLLLVKTYQGEMFKLPFVGDLAEQLGNQE